jgi:hypothetical protein
MKAESQIITEKIAVMKEVHRQLREERYFNYVGEEAQEKMLVFLTIESLKGIWFDGHSKRNKE